MKLVELHHLDEVKGNFGMHDGKYYRADAVVIEGKLPPYLIVSNVKIFVEQQQYFFDMFWRKIIPAKQRINEIEEDLKRVYRNNSRLGRDSISVHDLDLSVDLIYYQIA